jgi:D-amino-acid dehydrogenase
MKVAIVGAGIIGVTTAWELARDGHEVAVFDRRGGPAEEASFANAGGLTSWTGSAQVAIKLRWPFSIRDLRWMRARRPETWLIHRARLQRLALYSRTRLHEITGARELDYERSDGTLVLLRSKREEKGVQAGLDVLRAAGIRFGEINADEARKIEPALSADTELAGAIHLPDDEVANCRQFAQLLKSEAEALGAGFHFHCDLAPLKRSAPTELSLASGSRGHRFDAVVVCAGAASADLLRPLGLRLPLMPIYGHSISAQIQEPLNAPRSAVMDERHKVTISRLGQRVRVAGGAEIVGSHGTLDPASLQMLYKALQDWFPGAATLRSGVQQWQGTQPMLPDGLPILGPSGIPGVWLNLGHGSSGWALACGSARVVADLMQGRDPGVDLEGFGIERLLK